jgi:hypothetical protein
MMKPIDSRTKSRSIALARPRPTLAAGVLFSGLLIVPIGAIALLSALL